MRFNDDEITGFRMSGKPPQTQKSTDSMKLTMAELAGAHRQSHAVVEKLQELILRLPKVPEERNFKEPPRNEGAI